MPHIIEINDLNAEGLEVYNKLSEAELRHFYGKKGGLFIAESPKVIERAMNAGYEPVSILAEYCHIDGEAKDIIFRCGDIPVYAAEERVLTGITGFKLTRGVLCAMKRASLPSVEQICRDARRVAVLEDVVNPTNVGAIIRSAAALGIDAVLLTSACSDPLYRRAARVSMGTVFQVPWTYLGDNWIEELHKEGFKTAAMALCDNSVSVADPRVAAEKKLAIVLGTEGDGLSEQTIAQCDYTVKIPMSNNVDSLNVAAAAAVVFWQLGGNS